MLARFRVVPSLVLVGLPLLAFLDALVFLSVMFLSVPAASAQDMVLDVERGGNGSGRVTSSPAGIDCGGDCTADYGGGTPVVLTAVAGTHSRFERVERLRFQCGDLLHCHAGRRQDRHGDVQPAS